jgi:hypothetical protein
MYLNIKMIEPIEFLKNFVNYCATLAFHNAPEEKKSRKAVLDELLWLPIFNNQIQLQNGFLIFNKIENSIPNQTVLPL